MYKDLSLKEKAKVIREGVRLGLNSIDDILSLYDEAISYLQGGPIVSPYGQWKYPGRDTIIPSNNITMDNVDYPVLGVSDTGDTKVMMPWNDYKFRGSVVYEHPLIDNQFQLGGNTKPTFDLWYPTIPKQKNDTSSYDLRRAYNMLPFDEMEKFRTINDYHLPSVAYDEKTDTYTFLKRNGHPTLNYELDWYNSGSPDALEFRERYKLDTLSLPWRYIPRTYLEGGNTLNYLNVPEYNIALYNTVSPLGDFPNFWGALAYRRLVKDKLKNGNIYERDYKVGDTQGEKTAMAAWAKRLGIPYDEQDLPVYNGDTVTLPNSLVLEIPYDTNMLKTRIQLNKALLDKYSKYRYSDVVDAAIKADLYNLDKLRETYKTGKPVGLTEFGWNSRQLVNNGEILPIEDIYSPLNVLGNYNVRYDKPTNRLYYSDEYDFNQFENYVPGESFRIRGYIDLDNNKALGGNLFKKGGIYINPKNKGKLTETMRRTGKSKYELAHSKNPLTRKRALFAINASHWNHKHDNGGHLFLEDGWMNTNLLTLFDKYGHKALVVEIDKPVRLNEVQVVADAPKPGSLNYDRYIANTYDAWLRGDVDINTLPTETRNRVRGYSGTIAALKGMDTAAKVAGITAAIPAGIIGGISFAPTAWSIMNNPIVDAVLTTHGAITAPKNIKEGVQELQEGNYGRGALDLGLTALDLYGAGNLAFRLGRIANPAYRARHAYNTIAPASYKDMSKRGSEWLKDLWNNPEIDYSNPKWYLKLKQLPQIGDVDVVGYTKTGTYLPEDVLHSGKIADEARMDAWAIYNGIPLQHGTYIKNADGTYSYNMKKIMLDSERTWHPFAEPELSGKKSRMHDFVTGAGGGLTDFRLIESGNHGNGVMHLEDIWDLHPFSRDDTSLFARLEDRGITGKIYNISSHAALPFYKLGNKLRYNNRKYLRALKEFKLENPTLEEALDFDFDFGPSLSDFPRGNFMLNLANKASSVGRKIHKIHPINSKVLQKLNTKMKNFEVGSISGGKPFKMSTDIPYHKRGLDDYLIDSDMVPSIKTQEDLIDALTNEPLRYGFNPNWIAYTQPIQSKYLIEPKIDIQNLLNNIITKK